MTDHANNAAAVAAGWRRVQIDRGAGFSPRYVSEYQKSLSGAGADGVNINGGRGESDVNQATADTAALNSLNRFRVLRYGQDATASKDSRGTTHTADVT